MSPPDPNDERGGLPSASKFDRLSSCPGSRALEASLPDESKRAAQEDIDEATETGTIVHAARETGNTLPLDREQMELYEAGLACEKKQVEKWAWTYGLKDYKEGPRESRLWLHDHNTMQPLLSAKLDVHYLAGPRMALCLDWKTGFSPNLVGSRGNWQLRVQALLLKQEHPELETIRVGFVKPRFETLDFTDYGEADLKYSYDSILLTLWWSTQPDAQRVPGGHCRYCTAKGICPEAGAMSLLPSVMARQVSRSAEMTWEMMVAEMQPVDLLKIFDMSTTVGKIMEAVKARLKGMPAEELAKLGLMLPEKGRKMDYVAAPNMPQAFQFLLDHFAAPDVLKTMDFVKERQVELVQRDKQLGKSDAEAWLDKNLDLLLTRTHAKPSLRRLKE